MFATVPRTLGTVAAGLAGGLTTLDALRAYHSHKEIQDSYPNDSERAGSLRTRIGETVAARYRNFSFSLRNAFSQHSTSFQTTLAHPPIVSYLPSKKFTLQPPEIAKSPDFTRNLYTWAEVPVFERDSTTGENKFVGTLSGLQSFSARNAIINRAYEIHQICSPEGSTLIQV